MSISLVFAPCCILSEVDKLLCADAQTSGGLLISLPPEKTELYITEFNKQSEIKAQIIGAIVDKSSHTIFVD